MKLRKHWKNSKYKIPKNILNPFQDIIKIRNSLETPEWETSDNTLIFSSLLRIKIMCPELKVFLRGG
jgi:hypothetical protein